MFRRSWTLVALAIMLAAVPQSAQTQGLTVNLLPSARWVDWDDDLAFDRSQLFGGAVGIGFGRYVGLQGFYFQEDKARLFSEGADASRLFDLSEAGARLSLGLGSGTVVPMLTGGGSIFWIEPQEMERQARLSIDYGGGLRFVLSERIQGDITVESTRLRLDPLRLVGTSDPGGEGSDDDFVRRNLTLTAGLGFQLGRRNLDRAASLDQAFAERYQSPLSNFVLAVEPVGARLKWDGATGLPDQDMVGVRAGFDFGSFFGLRGLYWWGTHDDFDGTDGMTAWGGEAQFNLSDGPGVDPFLTGGVSRLSWDGVDLAEGADPFPSDQTALTLGGGIEFNLGSSLRLTAGVRDFVLSGSDLTGDGGFSGVSDPDELIHSWQYSAGLKFVIGGGRGIRSAQPASPRGETAGEARGAGAAAEGPRTVTVPLPTTAGVVADTGTIVVQGNDTIRVRVDPGSVGAGGAQAIVIPVLEQGEIYIRFGPPAGTPIVLPVGPPGADTVSGGVAQQTVGAETIRAMIREELARIQGTGGITADDLSALEARLQRRLDQIAAGGGERVQTVVAPGTVSVDPVAVAGPGRRVEEFRPYTGLKLSNGTQLLLGLGVDIGGINPGSSINIVPQAAFGFGEGDTSFLLAADFEYRLPLFDTDNLVLEPMVSAGPGLLFAEESEAVLNLFLGTGVRVLDDAGSSRVDLITGLQGIDLFNSTRLMVGLRMGR